MNNKKKILVLCTGNSCRSIMAEGLINHFGKDDFQAFSAGSKPTGYVHPMSIKTLKKDRIFINSKIDSLQNIVKSGYDDLKTDIKKIKNVTINVQNYSAVSDSALISRLLSGYGRN